MTAPGQALTPEGLTGYCRPITGETMNAEKQAQACNIFAKIQDYYTDHHNANGQIIPADMPYFVSDLLADLRHYCDAHGLDFAECDSRAHGHYLAEQEAA